MKSEFDRNTEEKERWLEVQAEDGNRAYVALIIVLGCIFALLLMKL